MRVLIAGGGTGGHVFPGIAVAEELRARLGAEVRFVGSSYGIERNAVPRAGFPVELLPIRGLRREGITALARTLWLLPVSLAGALRAVRRFAPDLVIGVGGYASVPPVLAAVLCRIPVVLLEQNAAPGLSTRLLARFARRVCVSFAATERALGGTRVVLTGNPIRGLRAAAGSASNRQAEQGEPRKLHVLVFGGSAGAHRLNTVVPGGLALAGAPLSIVHQTGAADYEAVRAAYAAAGLDAEVRAFIDDMAAQYARADLAICRAGATTLAELAAFGIPAILVPFPFAAGDHQRQNAEALVEAGAAWMVLDRELDARRIAELVAAVRAAPERLATMRRALAALGRPDAAARVVDQCLQVLSAGESA
jgi:UDP-N-acetylglucosamine--N-acetylmuramyl-(pentapeptide) pyrophosphoryl-undecaprenol N-acetylglucosamine transferase